jgi:hypothetical protein
MKDLFNHKKTHLLRVFLLLRLFFLREPPRFEAKDAGLSGAGSKGAGAKGAGASASAEGLASASAEGLASASAEGLAGSGAKGSGEKDAFGAKGLAGANVMFSLGSTSKSNSLGRAKVSLGRAKVSLGRAKVSLGRAKVSLGIAKVSLGIEKVSLGRAFSSTTIGSSSISFSIDASKFLIWSLPVSITFFCTIASKISSPFKKSFSHDLYKSIIIFRVVAIISFILLSFNSGLTIISSFAVTNNLPIIAINFF